jgi:hypothetical protein
VAAAAEADHAGRQVDADALGGQLGRRAGLQAQLVQARAGAHQHREGLRRDLHVERAVVLGGHVVEGPAVVGEQAHEDVDAAGRALRVAARRDARRQLQALLQLGDVDAAALEHDALGQVELVHGDVGQAVGHLAAGARQEGGAHAPDAPGQAQVEAGRLHLVIVEGGEGGDRAGGDQVLNGLAGQNACGVG